MYEELFLCCGSKGSKVQYAFQRHLINVFEASFHFFVHKHFREDLKSEKWRQKILTDASVGQLWNLPWDKAHAVEVKDWIKLMERVQEAHLLPKDALADPDTFAPRQLTPAFTILGYADYIRNKTFHRADGVSLSLLRVALQIPRVLKDDKKSDELEAMYTVIDNDPELDAPSSQSVRNILFPPHPESGTCLEVYAEILSMLEEGSFYFAKRENCPVLETVLRKKRWTEPEDGEMQIYAIHWEDAPCEYYDLAEAMKPEECANLDEQFFLHEHLREAVMSDATDLRNSVCHRHLLSERDICYNAWNAILCFILMGDRIRAIEVETLVEAFLTKTLQKDALLRLFNASWNDDLARREAIVEVCRRKCPEANELGSPKSKLFPVSPKPSSDWGNRWAEISKSAKARRSIKYDVLKLELWYSAVHRNRPYRFLE